MHKTHVVLHHSATQDSGTVSWNAIRRYHLGLGWADIGYHLGCELVEDAAGEHHYEVFLGRALDADGAHCYQGNMNRLALGVCFVGNFDLAHPPDEMLFYAAGCLAPIMRVLGIPADRAHVHPHSEFAPKTCPGTFFPLDAFIRMLRGA